MSLNTDHSIPGWHPDPQDYAIAQERSRHDQAMGSFGEYAWFVLMWNILDHEAGLVDRCPRCYESYGKTAQAYGQSAINECPECFGTTFEGGYKARIVRESLWDYNEDDFREQVRGVSVVATATVQSTSDFRLRTGDYIIRADNTRWQVRTLGTNHLRTGFQMPSRARDAVGYNYGQVSRDDESAVSAMIPPVTATEAAVIDVVGVRRPVDFSHLEDIRAPLR